MMRRLVAAVAALALLTACSGPSDRAGEARSRSFAARAATATVNPQAALQAVNAYRAARGLSAVALDPQVMEAARSHSRAMQAAGVMSHDAGASFSSRMAAMGARGGVENIAAGQRSLDEVMASWRNSSGHAANMAATGMTRMGIAVVGGYWTLILTG